MTQQPLTPKQQVTDFLTSLSANTPEKGSWNWLEIYRDAKRIADTAESVAREEFERVLGKER